MWEACSWSSSLRSFIDSDGCLPISEDEEEEDEEEGGGGGEESSSRPMDVARYRATNGRERSWSKKERRADRWAIEL